MRQNHTDAACLLDDVLAQGQQNPLSHSEVTLKERIPDKEGVRHTHTHTHTHTQREEYYSAVKRSETVPLAATWMDWEGFPGGAVVKSLPTNAGDAGDSGSNPGKGRSPGEGNGNSLQYS